MHTPSRTWKTGRRVRVYVAFRMREALLSEYLPRMEIAIIGAGLSGLLAGRALRGGGHDVTLFEKARGPSGRMSTRRQEGYAFDHGAQYFTVRDETFQAEVDTWIEAGVAAAWEPRLAELRDGEVHPHPSKHTRYVGTPRMSAIGRHLSAGQDVRLQTRVTSVVDVNGRYALHADERALGTFDAIVVTTPPEQAAPLLALAPELQAQAAAVRSDPCFAAMVVFDTRLEVPFDGAWVSDSPLAWVARNTSKPGRPQEEAWVLHATPTWTQEHVEDDRSAVGEVLVTAFCGAARIPARKPVFSTTHRWMLSMAEEPLQVGALWSDERRLGLCGDWLHGCRVEGAALSGWALADRIGSA